MNGLRKVTWMTWRNIKYKEISLDDVDVIFNDSEDHLVIEKKETRPVLMNAFELISTSQGSHPNDLPER